MKRILGMDLGTNSIGWALIEDNRLVDLGVKVSLQLERQQRRLERIRDRRIEQFLTNIFSSLRIRPAILRLHKTTGTLSALTLLFFGLSLFNRDNWQFWLNLSLTVLVTLLTILHQDKK
jgi:hypothetical protein